jgi:hypothetical protein
LFLVRKVRGQERGHTLRTEYGQVRPTDNAPVWWIHFQLISGQFQKSSSFSSFVESIPCRLFEVRLPENINQAGWHVAHIFDVKDRNVFFDSLDRDELLRRTARNIHPCNYFYIPKTEWRRYGGNHTVIAFFYEKFKSLYRSIWDDFLLLVDDIPPFAAAGSSEYRYSIPRSQEKQGSKPTKEENFLNVSQTMGNSARGLCDCVVRYEYSRLCFKADMIEQLDWDDTFCVVTPEGTFAMTKQEFYETFPNVVLSVSYKRDRIYHYPKTPQKAMQFKLGLSDPG